MTGPEIAGMIFNIQRFSIHDGPGIRSTVFFKGCPLRCYWCHNPEGLHILPQLLFWQHRCSACRACASVCQAQAHTWIHEYHSILREECLSCFRCAAECYNGALEVSGKQMSVAEVMQQVLADQAFYTASGGGVTLSGGEPLMQPKFCLELLKACKQAGLHTCVQTCAETDWNNLLAILPYVDLFLVDLKVMDEMLHRKATGKSNKQILDNIRQLAKTKSMLHVRIPVIPGFNDSVEMISAMASYLTSLREPRITIELLPFHQMAHTKYDSLSVNYQAGELQTISKESMAELLACIA
jgi:pyruvate formate lyase activating enzyme